MANETALPPAISGKALHELVRAHCGARELLWGVADAARDRKFALAARDQFGKTVHSLFYDDAPDHMHDVAPYLCPIDCERSYPYPGSAQIDLWARQMGQSSGIMFLSGASAEDLAIHLRRCFRATDETGHRLYFRFYDPRVLRTFMGSSTAAEAAEFQSPMRLLFVEGQTPGTMLACTAGPDGFQVEQKTLAGAEESQEATHAD